MADTTILVVGTYDTKADELGFLADVIRAQGGRALTMDVSVLGDPVHPADFSKHDVAQEGGHSIQEAIQSGDENHAMQIMAKGASLLAARLCAEGAFEGVLVLGGHDGHRPGLGCDGGLAPGRAQIHRLHGVVFAPHPA